MNLLGKDTVISKTLKSKRVSISTWLHHNKIGTLNAFEKLIKTIKQNVSVWEVK